MKYLHAQEPPIIHRDIKPQNIKITPSGRAVLVDFGIAKIAELDEKTSEGAVGVTPGFSPPEQYSGAGTSVVSDVYALGATLYAILTAKRPPDSITIMTGMTEFEAPNTVNNQLSQQVSDAIVHAMQGIQRNRPQSILEWQRELGLSTGIDEGLTVDVAISFWLVGPDGINHKLSKGNIIMGRSPTCDIRVNDRQASREHASLEFDGTQCMAYDEGSANGTFVNDAPIAVSGTPLNVGDQLRIGDSLFSLQVREREIHSAPPPISPQIVVDADITTAVVSDISMDDEAKTIDVIDDARTVDVVDKASIVAPDEAKTVDVVDEAKTVDVEMERATPQTDKDNSKAVPYYPVSSSKAWYQQPMVIGGIVLVIVVIIGVVSLFMNDEASVPVVVAVPTETAVPTEKPTSTPNATSTAQFKKTATASSMQSTATSRAKKTATARSMKSTATSRAKKTATARSMQSTATSRAKKTATARSMQSTATSRAKKTATARSMKSTATSRAKKTATAKKKEVQTQLSNVFGNGFFAINNRTRFYDDFSSNRNEWLEGTDTNEWGTGTTNVSNGKYKQSFAAKKGLISSRSIPNFSAKNFFMSVDVKIVYASDVGVVAITFRRNSDNDYYVVHFDNEGYYNSSLYYKDEWHTIQKWTSHSAINLQNGVTNNLAVLVQDSTFTVYANGIMLTQVSEPTLTNSGNISLAVSLDAGDSMTVEWDNLVIQAVE